MVPFAAVVDALRAPGTSQGLPVPFPSEHGTSVQAVAGSDPRPSTTPGPFRVACGVG